MPDLIMNNLEFSILLFLIAHLAGIIGVLTGLGGGVIIVPALVILLEVDLRYAMGASLISVIATSSGAALTFMHHHFTNLRIGMFLEVGAVIGAIVGAFLIRYLPVTTISIIFGIVILFSIILSIKQQAAASKGKKSKTSHAWALHLSLEGHHKTSKGLEKYPVLRVPLGFSIMTLAGAISGLLGIGSGAVKVLALDLAMGLPYKVATGTSNFMIGMTAAASAGIYLASGYIYAPIAFPVMLGVLVGSLMGSKLLVEAKPERLRIIFIVVLSLLAIQMIYRGFSTL